MSVGENALATRDASLGSRFGASMRAGGQRRLVVLLVGACLVALVVPPLFYLLKSAFTIEVDGVSRPSLERFADLLHRRSLLSSMVSSFTFAAGSAALALAIGGTTAWLVERTDAPFKRLTYISTVTSLGTPYVLYTGAWLLLLARSGPINAWYRDLTGSTGVLIDVYSMGGMILIEGLLWSPLVFLMLGASLRGFNPELEEAALICGAGPARLVRSIVGPLMLPAVTALALLIFIRSVEAFEVPALVGLPGKIRVLTTEIYELMNRTSPPDIGAATALATVLLILVGLLLYGYGRLTRGAGRFATVTGKNFRPRLFALGGWRSVAGIVLLLNFVLLIVMPTAILLWASLLPFYQPFRLSALPRVGLTNYVHVFNASNYGTQVVNTLVIAATAATAVVTLTALSSWLAVRGAPGGKLLDQLGTAPLVLPGIVLGVGVIQFFLAVPLGLYGTIWIIAWAFVINYLPYGARYAHAGMLQLHGELEEAAAMSGASPLYAFWRIVVPLLAPSLVAGWLFIFLLSTRVLSLPVLLAGPTSQTMAVVMFDLWTNGQGPELAALGLLWTAGTTIVAVVLTMVSRRARLGGVGPS